MLIFNNLIEESFLQGLLYKGLLGERVLFYNLIVDNL